MIDRISIPALRERKASASEPYVLRPDERDALVEAVEAVHAHLADPLLDDWTRAHLEQCLAARGVPLARFDFGEQP